LSNAAAEDLGVQPEDVLGFQVNEGFRTQTLAPVVVGQYVEGLSVFRHDSPAVFPHHRAKALGRQQADFAGRQFLDHDLRTLSKAERFELTRQGDDSAVADSADAIHPHARSIYAYILDVKLANPDYSTSAITPDSLAARAPRRIAMLAAAHVLLWPSLALVGVWIPKAP
jgi:hypothetical protein